MTDLESIHEEMRRIRDDADKDVRLTLTSIERSITNMEAAESGPKADRLKEVRSELDRLSNDADGEVAERLDRLRERVREYEREQT